MTDSSPVITSFLDELEILPLEAISLTPEQMERAAELSDRATHPHQRWQVYLNSLALIGFEAWLEQRTTDLTLNSHSCTILEPELMDAAIAVCNLYANGFKLCLIGTGSLLENELAIPKAAIDDTDLKAHFYVPIEVNEEQGQVLITGFLRSDQLNQHQQITPLIVGEDDTYRLPLQWFEPDANQLLLYLSCLEPAAIPLSTSATQNASILNPLHQILVEPLVNAGVWLQQQWDELAQDVGWILLPPVELASEMRSSIRQLGERSPVEEFNTILTSLERGGMSIPVEARGAYRELNLGGTVLRLYAVTAAITETQSPEWSLLLILKTSEGFDLPAQIQLQVSDLNQSVITQVSKQQTDADYLYTRVIGNVDEQFLVTLFLEGESLTLSPFAFQ
jgi:hypothetical protein